MSPITAIDEGLERLAAFLDHLDPTPTACTVAGCVHHEPLHEHHAFAGAVAA